MKDILGQANITFCASVCVLTVSVHVWVVGDLRTIMVKELYCSSFC